MFALSASLPLAVFFSPVVFAISAVSLLLLRAVALLRFSFLR